jgi:hypothetical protein
MFRAMLVEGNRTHILPDLTREGAAMENFVIEGTS